VLIPLLGIMLGLVVLGLEHVTEPLSELSALGGPWLVVAFMCGAAVRNRVRAALAGVLSLSVATAAYYGAKALFGSPINPAGVGGESPEFWLMTAVVVGAVFGVAGAIWASGPAMGRIFAVTALTMVFMWDVLATLPQGAVRLILIGIALSMPVLLLRTLSQRALGVMGVLAGVPVVGSVADVVLPSLLRFRWYR
jgi:hypothetical protein